MRNTDRLTPSRGFPNALSPSERSALQRRWRPVIPLALAVLSLVSLVLVLLRVEHQTRASLDEFTSIVDPARAAVTTIELTLALERSDVSGFLLTGDPEFVTNHLDERAARTRAQTQLLPLAKQLGALIDSTAMALVKNLQRADSTLDSLYDGRLSRARYTEQLHRERSRFAATIQETSHLEAAILQASEDRRQRFMTSQRWAALLSSGLAIAAGLALVFLGRLSIGFRSRAMRLDAREHQQSALRETARALNATVNVGEAARTIADGAVAGTTAAGAVVELAGGSDAERVITSGVAVRDGAPSSSDIPYEQSLIRAVTEGDGTRAARAEKLVERMGAPASVRDADLHGTLIPIVSDGRVRGALAVARPSAPDSSRFMEDLYLGALMELASSVLRRVELVSQLRDSEERFQQVADNIRGFVWLREPDSSKFLYGNPAYEAIWGRSLASLYEDGLSFLDAVHPDDRARVTAVLPPAPPRPYELEYRLIRPDGETRWVWSRGFPVRDENGEIQRMAGVTEDITERKLSELAQAELVERERAAREAADHRREELERVTESRTRLVRGFTHDVKNPLGAADGFLALLEEGVFGQVSEKQDDSIKRARGAIHRALDLIAGVLELARAETAELELEKVAVDVRETITEVASEFQAQAEAKGQDVTTDVAADVPEITSDPSRIRQIVGNLLSNAIKYTPERGHIAVQIGRTDGRTPAPRDWVVVDVTDDGPGIPADQVSNVFKEFTRLSPETASGAGVGLAISQRLARALGGRLTVESRVGQGSRFSLWLPRNGASKSAA